ncbi:MAG: glycosyltransferase family 9 protein [Oligoflexales bacterium]
MKARTPILNQLDAIVWLQTAFLGDMILSTGAFNLAKREAPHLQQYLITSPIGKAALEGHDALSGIFPIKKKRINFFFEALQLKQALKEMGLHANNCVLIQLHRSTRSSLISKLIGLPVLTYEETSLSFLSSWRVKRVAVFHECTRNALLLESLGINRNSILRALPSLNKNKSSQLSQDLKSPFFKIGIAPGSAWQTKKWPMEKFKLLISMLVKHQNVQLVLLGSNDEISLINSIREGTDAEFSSEKVIDLVGKTKLDDLRFVYPQLDLLISNDSSPIHYASAFKVPTIAIFGATVSAMGFGPLAPKSTVVERKELTCRPCSAHGPNKCPLKHFKCMIDISAGEVYQKVLEYLPHKGI